MPRPCVLSSLRGDKSRCASSCLFLLFVLLVLAVAETGESARDSVSGPKPVIRNAAAGDRFERRIHIPLPEEAETRAQMIAINIGDVRSLLLCSHTSQHDKPTLVL